VVGSLRSHVPIVLILTYYSLAMNSLARTILTPRNYFNGQLAGRIVKRVTGIPDSESESRLS